jgi:uncharacterized damage-inducible protein DinB
MITDVEAFIRWFESVNRRAMRDVGALPEEAERWRPGAGEGEDGWSIGELVAHMAASRMFFVSAFVTGEWVTGPWAGPSGNRGEWLAALADSAAEVRRRLEGAPAERLSRRIPGIDDPGVSVAGWRLLMMMAEHDIHHRSQIDTYAGINGWEVRQIFGRTAEQVGLAAGLDRPGESRG